MGKHPIITREMVLMSQNKDQGHGHIREDETQYLEKGKRLYMQLRPALEKEHKGKVVAIDPDSGDYIIGLDELDTARKARMKFPGKLLDYFRIGEDVMHKFRRENYAIW
jgi:hypothetical protein